LQSLDGENRQHVLRAAYRGLPPGRAAHARPAGTGFHLGEHRKLDTHSPRTDQPHAPIRTRGRATAIAGADPVKEAQARAISASLRSVNAVVPAGGELAS